MTNLLPSLHLSCFQLGFAVLGKVANRIEFMYHAAGPHGQANDTFLIYYTNMAYAPENT